MNPIPRVPLALLACTLLAPVACETERRVEGGGGRGEPGGDAGGVLPEAGGGGGFRCNDDADCPVNLPACVAGQCKASHGGQGEGEGEGGGEGEGEGEGAREGEGEGEGGAPGEGICARCEGDPEECGGEEHRCITFQDGNSYCSQACAGPGDCPVGFVCVEHRPSRQCLPLARRCADNCAVAGCATPGEVCDPASGECGRPKGQCDPCVDDAECAGGACVELAEGWRCLDACPGGQGDCPAESTCSDAEDAAVCQPEGGICNRCAGVECDGLTPECNSVTGLCVACLEDADCGGDGFICVNYDCQQGGGGGCRVHADCAGDPGGALCFVGQCVGCITAEDCGPRHRCEDGGCVDAPCEGVQCVAPAACNPANGRCEPSCLDDGCPEAQLCDDGTGQCYNEDGTCDAQSPCRPGSVCGAGGLPLPGEQEARCTCPMPGTDPLNSCQSDADCHPLFSCEAGGFGGGMFCADLCQADGDCPDGWNCEEMIGAFLKACRSGRTYCHPGIQCSGGACGGGPF